MQLMLLLLLLLSIDFALKQQQQGGAAWGQRVLFKVLTCKCIKALNVKSRRQHLRLSDKVHNDCIADSPLTLLALPFYSSPSPLTAWLTLLRLLPLNSPFALYLIAYLLNASISNRKSSFPSLPAWVQHTVNEGQATQLALYII